MTATQIAYYNAREAKRHNLVTEGQGEEQITINASTLYETIRHNKATEGLTASQIQNNFKIAKMQNKTTRRGQSLQAKTQRRGQDIDYALGKGNLKEKIRTDKAHEVLDRERNALQRQKQLQDWKMIQSNIGKNEAENLYKYAQTKHTDLENQYFIYDLLARSGDIGKLAAVLGIALSSEEAKAIKEDVTNPATKIALDNYFRLGVPSGTVNGKEWKPKSKTIQFGKDVLDKMSSGNWSYINMP